MKKEFKPAGKARKEVWFVDEVKFNQTNRQAWMNEPKLLISWLLLLPSVCICGLIVVWLISEINANWANPHWFMNFNPINRKSNGKATLIKPEFNAGNFNFSSICFWFILAPIRNESKLTEMKPAWIYIHSGWKLSLIQSGLIHSWLDWFQIESVLAQWINLNQSPTAKKWSPD